MRLPPPRPPQRRPRLLVEELDPRILYSADAAALLGLAGGPTGAEVREFTLAPPVSAPPATAPAAQVQTAREIVFVDRRVPDALALADQLVQQRGGDRSLEIVLLDANEDGLAQIERVLSGEHDLAAVHLISHGSEGAVQLGASVLDAGTLAERRDTIAGWGQALAADGDLLLYGCSVAGGTSGQLFLRDLSALTGADVAASTGLTGSAAIGGDWTLEFATGTRAHAVHGRAASMRCSGRACSRTTWSPSPTPTTAALGSLRQAIHRMQMRMAPALDTITFSGVGTRSPWLQPAAADRPTRCRSTAPTWAARRVSPSAAAARLTIGLNLVAGSDGSTVRGLVVQNFTSRGRVRAVGAANVTIAGNYIGTDAGGNFSAANNVGVDLFDAANARIGGTTAADRNVISGNSNIGINIVGSGNAGTVVSGNYIGTNTAGSGDLGNANHGIYVNGVPPASRSAARPAAPAT